MLRETFAHLTERIEAETHRLYGERLVSLALFGSVARGRMGPDSDIDLLIVADPLPAGRMARVREFDAVEAALAADLEAAARAGVHTYLSPVFKTRAEVDWGSPLFLDMTLDARLLYDRDSFFARRLDALRARLQALGSQRKQLGGGYYWVLKPDWQPGEEIRL